MGNREGEQRDVFLPLDFLNKCITLIYLLCGAIFSSPFPTTTKNMAEGVVANVFEGVLGWWREGPRRVHLLGRKLTTRSESIPIPYSQNKGAGTC